MDTISHSPTGPVSSVTDPADVAAWRMGRLLEGGFGEQLATSLAANPRVDVHALLQLVDRGCPPTLAARILGPDAEPQP